MLELKEVLRLDVMVKTTSKMNGVSTRHREIVLVWLVVQRKAVLGYHSE